MKIFNCENFSIYSILIFVHFGLFLICSDPGSVCYVQTSNLDGETNLKLRKVRMDLRKSCTCYMYIKKKILLNFILSMDRPEKNTETGRDEHKKTTPHLQKYTADVS